MTDRLKQHPYMIEREAITVTQYRKLEKENEELKARIEKLQRQVEALVRRQNFLEGELPELPTRH